jgi:ornithine cyclodeaminase
VAIQAVSLSLIKRWVRYFFWFQVFLYLSGGAQLQHIHRTQTLRLKAVLCDEGLLTEIRTAAAAAVATRAAILASGATVKEMGIVGGGVQAIWHLRLLAAAKIVDPQHTNVIIKTRSRESAVKFIQTMHNSPYEPDRQWIAMEPYGDKRFKGCQVIHTVTPSRTPVLDLAEVDMPKNGENPFLHVSAIGSDSPGKCEVALDLLKEADIRLVDSLAQTAERGEFQVARRAGFDFALIEIGEPGILDTVTAKLMVARGENQKHGLLSIFDSSGMAMQDVQMAKLVAQHI